MNHTPAGSTASLLTEPAITNGAHADLVLGFVGAAVVVSLGAVLAHRLLQQRKNAAESSMTRPVLAVLLVGSLVILAAASLTFADAETRNLLVGGVVSLSSAAAAYYFASSGATEARRDLLAAGGTLVGVPNLVGKTLTEAQAVVSGVHLVLTVAGSADAPAPAADKKVTWQNPAPGATARGGQPLIVAF